MNDCTCAACTSPCFTAPGRMLPGEALRIMEYLDRVGLDGLVEKDAATHALRPKIGTTQFGYEACVFLSLDRRCTIHAVKPYECREAHHSLTGEQLVQIETRIRDAWRDGVRDG